MHLISTSRYQNQVLLVMVLVEYVHSRTLPNLLLEERIDRSKTDNLSIPKQEPINDR